MAVIDGPNIAKSSYNEGYSEGYVNGLVESFDDGFNKGCRYGYLKGKTLVFKWWIFLSIIEAILLWLIFKGVII